MNNYRIKKNQARELAIDWQDLAALGNMSYGELELWGNIFRRLGKRWGLLREFHENGIPC